MRRPGGDIESVPFAVVTVGTDGCISSANATAHRMLGQPDGTLRGQRLDAVVLDEVATVYSVFQAGAPLRLQARMLKADGRVIEVSLSVEPTNRDGNQISSLTIVCKPLPPWRSLMPPPESSNADV
jgi:PAS domain-containing protein